LTFPGARHVIEAREWACWTDESQLARLPDDLTGTARAVLPLLAKADVVDVVRGETALVPGVQLVPAPGHTIGHCVVTFGSGSQQAIFLADAILDRLQLTQPMWVSAVDMLPDDTVATRTRLLDEAARDGSLVLAYTLPGLVRSNATTGATGRQTARSMGMGSDGNHPSAAGARGAMVRPRSSRVCCGC
jgi:glyoxylase-like metal-dependent hydrolase (beta-lactamase superfamily II)